MDSILSEIQINLMAEICLLCSKLGMRRVDMPELWKLSVDELKEYRDKLKTQFKNYRKRFEPYKD